MGKMIFALTVLWLCFSSARVLADGYFKFDGMYTFSKTKDGGGSSESTETLMNFGAGYISQKGWVIGGLYATEKVKSGGQTVDRTSMGPTVGWISRRENGFFILGTYFISSEFGNGYEGSGYEIDLGYKFKIRKVALAPQLSYKNFEYGELNGAKISPPDQLTKLDPYFVLLIEF